jgi:ethanolamine utilization protein EutN
MFLGRVVGTVWSSVKWPELSGLRLLLIQPYSLGDLAALPDGIAKAPENEGVVAADVLGAGPGEDVIVAYGHAARVGVSELLPEGDKPSVPIDAAVVAIVDRFAVDKDAK